jgi:hypothetical protein
LSIDSQWAGAHEEQPLHCTASLPCTYDGIRRTVERPAEKSRRLAGTAPVLQSKTTHSGAGRLRLERTKGPARSHSTALAHRIVGTCVGTSDHRCRPLDQSRPKCKSGDRRRRVAAADASQPRVPQTAYRPTASRSVDAPTKRRCALMRAESRCIPAPLQRLLLLLLLVQQHLLHVHHECARATQHTHICVSHSCWFVSALA